MPRRRSALLLIVIAVLGVLALLVVTQRPRLADRRDAADTAFDALRPELDQRYATVPAIVEALTTAGATDRGPTRALTADLTAWRAAQRGTDVEQVTDAANALEGSVARTRAMVAASDRYRGAAEPLRAAYDAYDGAAAPAPLVAANTEAVAAYRTARGRLLARPAVIVGGFGPRAVYEPILP